MNRDAQKQGKLGYTQKNISNYRSRFNQISSQEFSQNQEWHTQEIPNTHFLATIQNQNNIKFSPNISLQQ